MATNQVALQASPQSSAALARRDAAITTFGLLTAAIAILAIGELPVVVAMAVLFAVVASCRSPSVRATGMKIARARARRRREATRRRQVREAGFPCERRYLDLCELVDACDAKDAIRYDLEGLLDHFALTSVAVQRRLKALDLTACKDAMPLTAYRAEIRTRRLRERDASIHAVQRMEDDLDAIEDLVRLIVQRSCASAWDGPLEREIDQRLADLDEIDHARSQLATTT
jgi:hypothetical protein